MLKAEKDKTLLKQLGKSLESVDTKTLLKAEWLLKNPSWKEQPVLINEFIDSLLYLNLKNHIYPRIKQELLTIMPKATEEIFSGKGKDEAVIGAGIGSGKSFLSSVAIAYMVYLVACLKDPQGYFYKAPGTQIYFMNMSTNSENAKKVVFGEIKARIDNSPWFLNRFMYDKNINSELRFPKGISIVPGNSQETFFEGYNILGGVIDEADSHNKTPDKDCAEIGYDAIKGRIKSRFGNRGLVIIIGSPKTVDGFIMTKIEEGENLKRTHTAIIPVWEAHPKKEYCGETFHFKKGTIEIDVPVEYQDEFKRNPEKALRDLAAIPSYASEPFFAFPEKIQDGANPKREDPVLPNGRFKNWFRCTDYIPRMVHIDLGINKAGGDACGLAMGHIKGWREDGEEKLPIIQIDLMQRIEALKGGEILISDIRQRVYTLIEKGFKIKKVTMDGWQSTDSLQQFNKKRIKAELLSIDRTTAPYEALKEAHYDGRLDYYRYEPYIDECVHLELRGGEKIDHQPKKSKDVSDAVAGVVFNLTTDIKFTKQSKQFKPLFGVKRLAEEAKGIEYANKI